MWIVSLALRRPYTFVVMALLILILTPIVLLRTSIDIFPEINIPVISIVWQYSGMQPQEMADRFLSNTERGLTTLVNDIQHIESVALQGRAIEKIYFQPTANLQMAIAQVTAVSQQMVRQLPPGTQPPLIIVYSASSVPIVQVGISSKSIPEQELNDLPIKTKNGATIYVRDIGHVRDGFTPQTNIVRQDGVRGTLLSIMKNSGASTLDIVAQIKARLPTIAESLPQDLQIKTLFDQSLFVRGSIQGVLREGAIAAVLTALMILLFLRDWLPTVVIIVSIPLSICVSIILLSALGETINIMTLGGLALAVGILVDDATVAIENIERNLAMGKDMKQAILDGSQQIALPAFVSTICICIVFVPMFFLTGVAKYLFV